MLSRSYELALWSIEVLWQGKGYKRNPQWHQAYQWNHQRRWGPREEQQNIANLDVILNSNIPLTKKSRERIELDHPYESRVIDNNDNPEASKEIKIRLGGIRGRDEETGGKEEARKGERREQIILARKTTRWNGCQFWPQFELRYNLS
jgi:hypothetical protein